jgi:hypothetical protein
MLIVWIGCRPLRQLSPPFSFWCHDCVQPMMTAVITMVMIINDISCEVVIMVAVVVMMQLLRL